MKKEYILISLLAFVALTCNSATGQQTENEPITLEEALRIAPDTGKKILVDVYAEWCPYCQRMHSDVYKNDEVLDAISEHFIWVKINVESENLVSYHGTEMTEAQFARALENESVPTTYFLDGEGSILGKQPGYIDSEMFSKLLNFVGSDAFLSQTFQEYSER
jgi:thioredoxin-related protein